MRRLVPLILSFSPTLASADLRIDAALDQHILPRFAALTEATQALANAETCDVSKEWNTAAAAWIAVSHLRFGPTEADNRAFALAFWPDPRGSTPSALSLLFGQDSFDITDASIAGRGFYAMEFLLFDPAFIDAEGRCALVERLADDVHITSQHIEEDWQNHYADLMRNTGNDTFRDDTEALQELYKSVTTGLDFTTSMRLGRPLGTFDRPRPTRAEMWRSGRSLDNVAVSLGSLEQLVFILGDDTLRQDIQTHFQTAHDQICVITGREGGADLSLVENPTERIKVEALQQRIGDLRVFLGEYLGPDLGVIEGFNSLDGD